MDWEALRERTLGEVGTTLAAEGLGVAGGFVGAGFVGRQVQNMVKNDIDVTDLTSATMAWLGNNVPKAAIWYLLRRYAEVEPGETVTPMKEVTIDVKKSMAGSIFFDTIMRLLNGGKNPASASIYGWQVLGSGQAADTQKSSQTQADIQRLIQENSALRAELNKALQRLATQPVAPPAPVVQQPVVQVQAPVHAPAPAAPAPTIAVQPVVAAPAPQVVAQPAPPVVRYQPVVPYSAPPTPAPAPVVKVAPPRPAPAPVARPPMVRAEEQIPPYSPIPYSPGQPFAPYTAQPYPGPAVQERQRKYGFMDNVTPPAVQQREKKYGFMAGEEKDIAAMFGML